MYFTQSTLDFRKQESRMARETHQALINLSSPDLQNVPVRIPNQEIRGAFFDWLLKHYREVASTGS
jgi:hypothetical protein